MSDPASGEDGYLEASEIVRLKLNADLAVLSACDTGVGAIAGEEGVANLARSFLLAGARAVVSTLWSVEDNATSLLMERFYGRLATGQPPDEALANAKRSIIKDFKSKAFPYYWAAFTVSGASDRRDSGRTRRT
jgi:CHAT domain-containing protein